MRREQLENDCVYHVFTRSIAGFNIFNDNKEYNRIKEVITYYQYKKPLKFSEYKDSVSKKVQFAAINARKSQILNILAYCIMPTHLHFILRQLQDNGISIFMQNILNSYTRYFNTRHKRKGPLWEGRFKAILIGNDDHLLHLTRYIHLNPVTAYLVNKPEEWNASSYNEFLQTTDSKICVFRDILDIRSEIYRPFVEDRVSYQRELAKIKSLLFD